MLLIPILIFTYRINIFDMLLAIVIGHNTKHEFESISGIEKLQSIWSSKE